VGGYRAGHNIRKTVFIECRAFYLREGPEHLRPLGETSYISDLARQSLLQPGDSPAYPSIAGLVAHANLSMDTGMLHELLQQHQRLSQGLLRGIRHSAAHDEQPEHLLIPGPAPDGLYRNADFRRGLRLLASHDLTFDAWHYHHQNEDFLQLAQAVPEATLILDHFGTPLGVGPYRGMQDTIFRQWKLEIARLAKCPNVFAKLGGLAMPDNGFGWDRADVPPGSDELVRQQRKYYLHTIECFGPERCMFESNFPVDRLSVSYHVVWNAFKKMVADFSEDERHALFYDTAEKVYRL
jgi:L-fuconolactonase